MEDADPRCENGFLLWSERAGALYRSGDEAVQSTGWTGDDSYYVVVVARAAKPRVWEWGDEH